MTNSITGYGGVNFGSIQNMDLETALMAVQGQRASILEGQLKDQIQDVNDRNASIAKANSALSEIRSALAKIDKDTGSFNVNSLSKDTIDTLKALGIDTKGADTKAKASPLMEEIKGKIDEQSNNQQMDMLRLQSLSNKRNEAFDMMTNFIKKMNDSRSSVLANMR